MVNGVMGDGMGLVKQCLAMVAAMKVCMLPTNIMAKASKNGVMVDSMMGNSNMTDDVERELSFGLMVVSMIVTLSMANGKDMAFIYLPMGMIKG